jgi:hypothetical protein
MMYVITSYVEHHVICTFLFDCVYSTLTSMVKNRDFL